MLLLILLSIATLAYISTIIYGALNWNDIKSLGKPGFFIAFYFIFLSFLTFEALRLP